MAFIRKTWKDRNTEYPMRRKIIDVDNGTSKIVDIERAEGNVLEWGEAWNGDNMNDLEERIDNAINGMDIIADIETTLNASKSYNYGDFFMLQGTLYRVVEPIAIYDPILIGENAVSISVMNDAHDTEQSKLFILDKDMWETEQVEEAGTDYYIYNLAVNRIYASTILIKVGNESEELIASAEQREAFSLIVDAKGDTDTMSIKFYATDLPNIDVPIWIRGVI